MDLSTQAEFTHGEHFVWRGRGCLYVLLERLENDLNQVETLVDWCSLNFSECFGIDHFFPFLTGLARTPTHFVYNVKFYNDKIKLLFEAHNTIRQKTIKSVPERTDLTWAIETEHESYFIRD